MATLSKQFIELVNVTLSEKQQLQDQTDGDRNIQDKDKSAKSQDFFHKNNATTGKRYTTTRIKSINFLSNIAYVGINKEDYFNENFIFDVYLLMTKNLNPFSFDRKLARKSKYEMIYMLWKELVSKILQAHLQGEEFSVSEQ